MDIDSVWRQIATTKLDDAAFSTLVQKIIGYHGDGVSFS